MTIGWWDCLPAWDVEMLEWMNEWMDDCFGLAGSNVTLLTWRQKMGCE